MLRKKGDTYEIDRELTGKLAIESNAKLQEENEKLKEDNRDLRLTNIAMRRVLLKLDKENKKLKDSNIILKKGGQVVFTLEKRIDELLEKNRKLKEELGEYKKMFEDHLKESYIKNTAEFLDKKFGFMEKDTLQELKDLGKI